jgi:DNA-binding LacI/PurR family transcriptional regulator
MQTNSKRPTIKEVAAAAGVSTQTVSRVVNGRPDVSDDTRVRVQDIIKSLGYRPSAIARSLIQQRSFTLGVVTAGLKYIGPSRTLNGIASAAEAAGYSLLLKELAHFHAKDIVPQLNALYAMHVDGIIWAVPEIGDNRAWVNDLSIDLPIPILYLAMEPREGVSVVSINNYQGARTAVTHLVEQGYQHIGHISGPLDWWEARQRMAAWKDVLVETGRDVLDRHMVEGNWSSASACAAIEKLYHQYPEMDAIFAANDQMALAVTQFACQRNLRIPQDLAIVGFDDIAEAAYFSPPLTTMRQDQHELGTVAVQEVLKLIEANQCGGTVEASQTIVLTPTLIVRESSICKKEVDRK